MPPQSPAENFVQALTESQNRIYGYIYSLIGDHHRASDVLQECNLVLWRKAAEFREGADFIPWAFAIARFQVMAHLRDKKRDRLDLMDPELAELLADEVDGQATQFEDLRVALRNCMGKLPEHSRELLELRYFRKKSIQKLAAETDKRISAVKVALMRIRRGLRTCIEVELKQLNS